MTRTRYPQSGLAALLDALERELLAAPVDEVHEAWRNRSGAQHRSPRNPCTFERSHRRERRQSCFAALTARHLHRAGPASSRFERASSCPSRPSSPQRIFRFEPPPALTARAASAGQSKRLLRMLLVRCRRASPMWPLGAEPPRSEQGSTIPFPATRFPKSDGGR